MARVFLDRVSKTFTDPRRGEVQALRELSLAIELGECIALLGPSGCGKTTALRLVAGLEEPTSGALTMDGRKMAGVEPQERDVAMVFQHFALYPHLTVGENLSLGLKLRRLAGADIAQRVRETADSLGIMALLERLPKELSGGERQRVAIGRALIRRPKVLLFDEPLSNLDAPLRAQFRAEIGALHRRTGVTMLYVTHDQAEAMALAGRIAVLKSGELQQVSDPETIHRRPANVFVAGFVGSPAMNLFRGVLRRGGAAAFQPRDGGSDAPTWEFPTAFPLPARAEGDLILGLRPEHFRPAPGGEIHAVVETAEPLGSETLLRVRTGGLPFTVRMPPDLAPRRNERVELTVDWGGACWFDAASGTAL